MTVDGIASLKVVADAALGRFFDQCVFWSTRFVPMLAAARKERRRLEHARQG